MQTHSHKHVYRTFLRAPLHSLTFLLAHYLTDLLTGWLTDTSDRLSDLLTYFLIYLLTDVSCGPSSFVLRHGTWTQQHHVQYKKLFLCNLIITVIIIHVIIVYHFMCYFSQIRTHNPLQEKQKYSTILQNDKKNPVKILSVLTHWK